MAALFYRTQVAGPQDYRSRPKYIFCIAAEYCKGTLINRFFPRDVWGGGGFLPYQVSLTLKNIDFLQLIICCWLELDMSSLAGRDGI